MADGAASSSIDCIDGAHHELKAHVWRLVLVGGPCGGKTTAAARLASYLRGRGFHVMTVPEAATLLSTHGAHGTAFATDDQRVDFQYHLLRTQIQLEDAFHALAASLGKPSVLVCDRGTLDGAGYLPRALWERVLARLGIDELKLRDARYDAVLHLVTAARGAEEHYSDATNPSRTETPVEARAIDAKLKAVWVGHARLVVIDNSTDFESKLQRVVSTVASILHLPDTSKTFRRFLLRRVPDSVPRRAKTFEVEKVYLRTTSDAAFGRPGASVVRALSDAASMPPPPPPPPPALSALSGAVSAPATAAAASTSAANGAAATNADAAAATAVAATARPIATSTLSAGLEAAPVEARPGLVEAASSGRREAGFGHRSGSVPHIVPPAGGVDAELASRGTFEPSPLPSFSAATITSMAAAPAVAAEAGRGSDSTVDDAAIGESDASRAPPLDSGAGSGAISAPTPHGSVLPRVQYTFVRRRTDGRCASYGETTVSIGPQGQRIEAKRIISARDFAFAISNLADLSRHYLRVRRTCFLYRNHYFELYEYLAPISGLCIINVQLPSDAGELALPPFLEVEREITGDVRYSSFHVSLRKDPREPRDPRDVA